MLYYTSLIFDEIRQGIIFVIVLLLNKAIF